MYFVRPVPMSRIVRDVHRLVLEQLLIGAWDASPRPRDVGAEQIWEVVSAQSHKLARFSRFYACICMHAFAVMTVLHVLMRCRVLQWLCVVFLCVWSSWRVLVEVLKLFIRAPT